jgi:hypothetical protein
VQALAARSETVDHPDRFMARDGVGAMGGQVALGQMQIGAANTADADRDAHLARAGLWHRAPFELKRVARHGSGGPDRPYLHVLEHFLGHP